MPLFVGRFEGLRNGICGLHRIPSTEVCMSLSTRIRSFLRNVAGSSNFEQNMQSEMQFHMESYAEDLVRRGMSPQQARRQARLEFGGMELTKDACRSAVGVRFWDELWADARYALRLIRRNPGFTAVAVLTLSLGIGVNTSMFAIINGVLLRPLPFAEPDRLYMLSYMPADFPFPVPPSLVDGDYVQFRGQDKLCEQIAAFNGTQLTLTGVGEPVRLSSAQVTPEFFPLLRVAPAMGRGFLPYDTALNHPQVAIISNELWRSRFHSDPAIIGKTIEVESIPRTVIGVTPPGMDFPYKAQIWTTGTNRS